MLRTIKSKIICITLIFLVVLSTVTIGLINIAYETGKKNQIEELKFRLEDIDTDMHRALICLKLVATELSERGKLYYIYNGPISKLNNLVEDVFKNSKSIINTDEVNTGGIWYEPYEVYPNTKELAAYFDINRIYDIEDLKELKYNYLERIWYRELRDKILNAEAGTMSCVVAKNEPVNFSQDLMLACGRGIYDNDSSLVGIVHVDWKVANFIQKLKNFKLPKHSIVIFSNEKNDFIFYYSENKKLTGKSLNNIPMFRTDLQSGEEITYNNKKYITFILSEENGMEVTIFVPKKEMFKFLGFEVAFLIFALITFYIGVCILIYLFLTKNINKPIKMLVKTAEEIGRGNLDSVVNIEKPEEFALLANTLNNTSEEIKQYIETLDGYIKEKKQAEFELKIAKEIQKTAMPNRFPAFPQHKEFDIYATMETAREVGGDFYDFFFLNDDTLAFLIADVSGKGIPAALFMMKAKAVIKNIAKTEITLEQLFEQVNKELCQNNEQGLFVTAFFCTLELSTGTLKYLSAGHNPPFIKRKNGNYEKITCNQNFVLGGMPDTKFKSEEMTLMPNDKLFLYTDGLTDVIDEFGNLFGEEGIKMCLDKYNASNINELLDDVNNEIKEYSKSAEHGLPDDITMLTLEYKGYYNFELPSVISALPELTSRVENICNKLGFEGTKLTRMLICTEEIFTNIVKYGYEQDETKAIEVSITQTEKDISIAFYDKGKQFNPLNQEDPDITLSTEDRQIGGLGIYMVKQSMDKVDYDYKDGKNILTISMNL
ncbi:SpoIIE family protein phosphatase [bacterium]|nr:SpoIIE family protein phosphatase [bacterium]